MGYLLEVGTGFHPELTGRENIYMNGTILGMSRREIGRKFAEIVEFSGVEAFFDTPVKRYSTGMKVRPGFAVAAHLNPEILIVDEVLAVGGYQFQKRCLGKMESVTRESDRTVLIVSHQLGMMLSVRLCYRVRKSIQGSNLAAVLLSKGSPLLATFDTDLAPQFLEERLPGTYEAIFGLPVDVLKAGYYQIRFDCGLVNGSHMFHKPSQMLGFTIEEDHDTSLKSYSLNRQPLVACRVRWSTRTLEQHGKPASKRTEARLVSA